MNVRLVQEPSGFLDGVYFMLGPVLFPREHRMHIKIAEINSQQETTGYREEQSTLVGTWTTRIDRDEVAELLLAEIKLIRGNRDAELTLDSNITEDLEVPAQRLKKLLTKLSAEHDYRIETTTHRIDKVREELDQLRGQLPQPSLIVTESFLGLFAVGDLSD